MESSESVESVEPAKPVAEVTPFAEALAAYRATVAEQARNYDQTQDISPRQMLILLEVCERTGASLGQVLATGEYESARTWNDYVRPTLGSGRLGSATGVWQFIPSTFHRIMKRFGTQLLAASEPDAATGRARLDLGDGPFTDEQVRRLIQDTVDGKRSADDAEVLLLRHNFAVLAFAKHYLSVDSGAKTAEEDYLFHFLGEDRGRKVLALARGDVRDTLCVKMPDLEEPLPMEVEAEPELAANDYLKPRPQARAILQSASVMTSDIGLLLPSRPLGLTSDPLGQPRIMARQGLTSELQAHALSRRITVLEDSATFQAPSPLPAESAVWSEPTPKAPPPISSDWGLPADSPVVTGNLGMFYRDGKGQSQPYTWAEFFEKLGKRVRSKEQPAMVRAKYGVGFRLNGGDMPQWTFDPNKTLETVELRHELSGSLLVPEKLMTGPLDPSETQYYKQRLAELLSQGEDQPLRTLPARALSALQHLELLAPDVQDLSTDSPQVRKALESFRAMVGKDAPDDPAQAAMLMPTERVALELYDQRLARYAALQAGQQAALDQSLDLPGIRRLLKGQRQSSVPHIAVVQKALADEGLLTQSTKKVVWRDKRRKRHVSYEPAPFDGIAGKLTLGALSRFQLRNGLRQTQGILDGVTLAMLGLPPMGPEIFLPPAGPQCPLDPNAETTPVCEVPAKVSQLAFYDLIPSGADSLPRWWSLVQGGVAAGSSASSGPVEPDSQPAAEASTSS
ncbi:peptidoglycan-binding domain-containing protein [Thiocystis violacea]|uniref:peptidoglycan-binding domain-containing protein n=1 Tax=Thiocystis violacea TaxID=13725 RepID=UPI001F5B9E5C|nr:peptidoglycan-binding domain-containing protein [Thiocystis violacea]